MTRSAPGGICVGQPCRVAEHGPRRQQGRQPKPTSATHSPRITAPTLILHRAESSFIPVGHGRYLAEHIAGITLSSSYRALISLYWVGDTAPMLDEIEEFITGVRGGFDAERVLTTIVFTDIVGSTKRAAALGDDRWHDLLDNHDNIVRHELDRFGGREVNTAGDGFVATFTSPERRDRLRGRDRRRGPRARHRGAGRYSRRRGRGARRRRRRHGGAHRCARCGAGRPQRGAGVLDGARDRHRIAAPVRRARRVRTQRRARTIGALYALVREQATMRRSGSSRPTRYGFVSAETRP